MLANYFTAPQQRLYFFPEPHGQGAFRLTLPHVLGSFGSISAAASTAVLCSYAMMRKRPKLADPSSMIVFLTTSDLALAILGCFLSRTGYATSLITFFTSPYFTSLLFTKDQHGHGKGEWFSRCTRKEGSGRAWDMAGVTRNVIHIHTLLTHLWESSHYARPYLLTYGNTGQAWPGQTRPNQARPDQNRPNQTRTYINNKVE